MDIFIICIALYCMYITLFAMMHVIHSSLIFSKKTKDTYLKLEYCVVCREFLAFKYVFIVFFKQITWLFSFVHKKSWKLTFTAGFSVQNIHFYLCGQVENTKWILCSRKIGVKCSYLSFLMYKMDFNFY